MINNNKYLSFIVALYCFVSGAQIYNATYSIGTVLVVLCILLFCRKYVKEALLQVPKAVYWSLGVFSSSILISSIAIGSLPSIRLSLIMIYWMLPLFLIYMLNYKHIYDYSICFGLQLALLVTSVYGIRQFLQAHRRVISVYGQPNHLASMLDILLPFCVLSIIYVYRKNNSKLLAALMSINVAMGVYTLIISGSRGGMLGVSMGLIVMLLWYLLKNCSLKKYVVAYCCLFFMLCAGVIGFTSNIHKFSRSYDSERILLIKSSYNMWNDHKLVGVGTANWAQEYHTKYMFREAKEPHLGMPHNILAYFFSTAGIIGGMGYCACMLMLILFVSRYLRFGNWYCIAMLWALVAINVHGMVDVGITLKSAARLFYTCLGIVAAEVVSLQILDKGMKRNDQ